MASEPEVAAMRRAFTLARSAGVPAGPNPRVGCVILSPDGVVVAEGFHRGAGTPHAEVAALESAGSSARGATAIVTLEPCNHVGRTGPCSLALIDAGIARVVFSQADPHAVAAGGSAVLAAAGIDRDLSASKHCYLSVFVLWDRATNGDRSFFAPYYRILPERRDDVPQ